ncbi:MAG TPA: hypothetical protein VGW33_08630, partial [Terriglobia bacterium]|nr:hypothetical protein [Terriglobia bacterium]
HALGAGRGREGLLEAGDVSAIAVETFAQPRQAALEEPGEESVLEARSPALGAGLDQVRAIGLKALRSEPKTALEARRRAGWGRGFAAAGRRGRRQFGSGGWSGGVDGRSPPFLQGVKDMIYPS